MNTGPTCVGVLREPSHSPGRIDDDAAIMRRVGEALTERGFKVELITADAVIEAPAANLFVMCERGTVLDRLAAMEKAGAIVVNTTTAIRNTYRHRMVELFARNRVAAPDQLGCRHRREQAAAGRLRLGQALRFPRDPNRRRPLCRVRSRMARCAEPLRRARHSVRHRAGACAGRPGQILRRAKWRADQATPIGSNGSIIATKECWVIRSIQARLSKAGLDAAAALGLEVFGGDAVIKANGEPMIIDLNAWPSYALYRDRAAQAIADCLTERFQRRPRLVASARN